MDQAEPSIYVVSDAHLGAGDAETERIKSGRLLAFWDYVGEQQGDLVILGDLFDFWFEYKNAIPSFHFDHLTALRRLVDAGQSVWYVAGNHDFWVGPFLHEELGVVFAPDDLNLGRHGRKLTFAHGDGWLPHERSYRFMKRMLRSRFALGCMRMISPDISFPVARWLSDHSRGRHPLDTEVLTRHAQVARARLAAGTDVLATAHLHELGQFVWPEGVWLATGDWMRHFSFGRIATDGISLLLWSDEGAHTPVPIAGGEDLRLEPTSGT